MLAPLRDLAPALELPPDGRTVAELTAELYGELEAEVSGASGGGQRIERLL